MATQLTKNLPTQPNDWAREWAECNDTDMAHTCFDFYLDKSNSGLGQFSRISAVRFGSADYLSDALSKIEPDEGYFSLCMGIKKIGTLSHFIFFFRIQSDLGSDPEYVFPDFMDNPSEDINDLISRDLLTPGLVFGSDPKPNETWKVNGTEHRGISPEVINQFCLSWRWAESEELANLFKSNQPSSSAIFDAERLFSELYLEKLDGVDDREIFQRSFLQTFYSAANSFNGEVVRGLEYPIVGYNRMAIMEELSKGGSQYLNVSLGLNEGGTLLNKNKFSPIVEILSEDELINWKEIPDTRMDSLTTNDDFSCFYKRSNETIHTGVFIPAVKKAVENSEWIRYPAMSGQILTSRNEHREIDVQSYVSMGVDFVYPCPPFCDPPQIFEV